MFVFVCVYLHVCVCKKERERERRARARNAKQTESAPDERGTVQETSKTEEHSSCNQQTCQRGRNVASVCVCLRERETESAHERASERATEMVRGSFSATVFEFLHELLASCDAESAGGTRARARSHWQGP